MSMISISKLTFAYEGSHDNVFENVSFHIDTDWKLGLIGRNGRGKTTLLKLLMGKYEYQGRIAHDVEFEYFPYTVKNTDAFAIDAMKEVAPHVEDWRIFKEINRLALSDEMLYRPFNTLSYGERSKCLLAAMFLRENSFLLIDEPTNHLDVEGRMLLSEYLNTKKGFILVSHDRAFLDGCIDHIMAINRASIDIQKGDFSTWWKNKQEEDAMEKSKNEKLKGDIKRLNAAAKRTERWSEKAEKTKYGSNNSGLKVDRGYVGHKAAKMMKRSKAIENRQMDLIEEKAQLLKNIEAEEDLKITPLPYPSNRIIELRNINLSFGKKKLCKNFNLAIEQGDRTAICGKNGCGKSSVLKMILGHIQPNSGEIIKNGRLKISYVSQNSDCLRGNLSTYAAENQIDKTKFLTILRKLGFTRAQFEKDMNSFSEGQKKKVLIAASLCQSAHLYIWDEPLNYIDVISRIQLEELIKKSSMTLLFVEHDYLFLKEIATKKVFLSN